MRTISNQKTSENEDQPKKVQVATDVAAILRAWTMVQVGRILQEADKALLAGKPVVAHSCMRLAITELTNE